MIGNIIYDALFSDFLVFFEGDKIYPLVAVLCGSVVFLVLEFKFIFENKHLLFLCNHIESTDVDSFSVFLGFNLISALVSIVIALFFLSPMYFDIL